MSALQRFNELWSGLAERERRLAQAGIVLVSVTLVYLLVWEPIDKELTRLRTAVPEKQLALARMQALAAQIQPLRGRAAQPPAAGAILGVVDQSASARGLRGQITKLEADGQNGAQLTVEAMAFNSLAAWLAELQETNAVAIDQASLDAHTKPGQVSGKLRLRVQAP
jgi:general secretion pathway protein M